MGASSSKITVACKLVSDNKGHFAGLVPLSFTNPADGREQALAFARDLVNNVDKGFDAGKHVLLVPGVPTGHTDFGVHCSTHNSKFNGGPLSDEQIDKIQACTDTFTLTIDMTDYKVLVGSPSNDGPTGVLGYVGLLLSPESLPEYNRAMAVYGGVEKQGNLAHVSVCGWNVKGFDTSTDGRKAFGLTTVDGELYPDGKPYYTANVFPSQLATF